MTPRRRSARTSRREVVASRAGWTFAEGSPPPALNVGFTEVDGVVYAVFEFSMLPMSVPLSNSERAVAIAVMRGLSNADIAAERGVSVRTIANQLAAIYRKLGINSRFQLAGCLRGA